jgi:hypothetical protein
LLGEDGGSGSRRGEPDHLTAIFSPGESQGAHGGGFPGAGRCDRELQPCPRAAHLPDQRSLPGIQGSSVFVKLLIGWS